MSPTHEVRTLVRKRAQGRCGYCGVSELDVGHELEVDHYRPRAHGGDDALDNLVYTCTPCNRFKGAYWPSDSASDDVRLLNPNQDQCNAHMVEAINGRLVGLTARGWFHINWLHLNRPLLVAFRQRQQRMRLLAEAMLQAQATTAALQS
ncbi:MAG: HNH endonuclease, partial [Candidatus Viridilinea halotolerans]